MTAFPKKKDDKRIHKFLKVLLVLFLFQLIASFFSGYFFSLILKTVVVDENYIDHYISTKGLLGFDEKVVLAPERGNIFWLKDEGLRVAVGEIVGKIRTGGEEIAIDAPASGIFSPFTDGLESAAYPYEEWKPEKEVFSSLTPYSQQYSSGEEVVKGSPLFKVVNNFKWFFSVIISKEDNEKLKEDGMVHISFSFEEGKYSVDSFRRIKLGEEDYLVVFTLNQDIGDFYRRRWEEVKIIYEMEKAVIIPSSALVHKNGKDGVLRFVRSSIILVEVEIIKDFEEEKKVAVEGLDAGWEIVINPFFFREGQRL